MSVHRPNHSGVYIGQGSMGRKDEIIIQAEEALGTGDVLELPDGQSVKIDRNVAVGGRLKLQYAGKPF